MIKLKNNIDKLIDESPYKRSYIIKLLKISRGTLNNWISGNTFPPIDKCFILARILNVSIYDIYEIVEESENE